ncbi:MAG: HTH-type transcriptional regulator DegA [Verrucomicrobiae bacterium]|nr:HTH-type transcriptional regulator DegA [Verrucomicrobiae bacterium]
MVTQKDIANRLGVSPSLVSRVLNGSASEIGVTPETIERICAEATRLNYQPNVVALMLRGAPTQVLGVVVKNFDDPFFGRILAELESLASRQGYSLLLTGYASNANIHSLARYKLDGLILAGTDFVPDGLTRFISNGTRVVRIGCGGQVTGVTRVVADIEHGLEELVGYLAKLGHRDIAYLGDDTELSGRREGEFLRALKCADLSARPECIIRTRYTGVDTGCEAMQLLLRQCQARRPTAVIAAEDVLAQSALRALFEAKIQVPNDLSLASVDDIPSTHMTIPSLTTVRQPIPEMARRAFETLIGTGDTPDEIMVRPELIIRESCAPPPSPSGS